MKVGRVDLIITVIVGAKIGSTHLIVDRTTWEKLTTIVCGPRTRIAELVKYASCSFVQGRDNSSVVASSLPLADYLSSLLADFKLGQNFYIAFSIVFDS